MPRAAVFAISQTRHLTGRITLTVSDPVHVASRKCAIYQNRAPIFAEIPEMAVETLALAFNTGTVLQAVFRA